MNNTDDPKSLEIRERIDTCLNFAARFYRGGDVEMAREALNKRWAFQKQLASIEGTEPPPPPQEPDDFFLDAAKSVPSQLLEETDEASNSLFLAGQEAENSGHKYIKSDHVLLGLIVQDTSTANYVFNQMGISYFDVHAAAQELTILEPTGFEDKFTFQVPFSERTTKTFSRSDAVAKELGAEHVGTKHMLLALIDVALEDPGASRFAELLATLRIDLVALRQKVISSAEEETIKPGRPYFRVQGLK